MKGGFSAPGDYIYFKSQVPLHKIPASDLHKTQGVFSQSQQSLGGGSTASTNPKSSTKKKSSDLKYDIFRLIILTVGIFAWIGMAKSNLPK